MEKKSLHEHLCLTTHGLPTYPAVGIAGVVLESHCRWFPESKRAEARVDYLTAAQDKEGMCIGEATRVTGKMSSYRELAGSNVLT